MSPALAKDDIRSTISRIGVVWLGKRARHCDWCGRALTLEDIAAFGDWCLKVTELVPAGRPRPASKVPCLSCAGPALTELVEGIRFDPHARQSDEPLDPWGLPQT